MNNGPAESGTPGQPGERFSPSAEAHAPHRDTSVADIQYPLNPNEWPAAPTDASAEPQRIPAAVSPNGYATAPILYPPPGGGQLPPGASHAAHGAQTSEFWESIQAWFRPRAELRTFELRRNLPLGVAIAGLNAFADALLLPAVTVAAFVAQVSGSNRLVALVPVVAALSWALPGLITGSPIANRVQAVVLAVISAAVRAMAMGLLALIGAGRADGTAQRLMTSFFVLYAIVGCASGFATLAGQRLPGRISTNGLRGRIVRWQALAAAIASVFAALLARRIIAHGPVFPRQYLYLFFVSFLALLGVVLLTAALTERAPRVPVTPRPLFAGLRAAPELLRLPAYRRYLIFRVVALVATLAEPFYIVYALRSFNLSYDMVGVAVLAVIGTRAVTMYLWRLLARLTGTKVLLQLAALCRALAAVIAIGLPVLFDTDPIASCFTSDLARAQAFTIVFLFIGAAMGANAVAHSGFLLDTLPPNAYGDGVAVANGVLAVCSIALIAGGIILDRSGFRALFITALILGLLTVLTGGILREPRRPLRRSGALGPGIRRTEAFAAIPRQTDSFPTVPPYQR